jgi:hypothetical protein
MKTKNTAWLECTAIPIQALRNLLDGSASRITPSKIDEKMVHG